MKVKNHSVRLITLLCVVVFQTVYSHAASNELPVREAKFISVTYSPNQSDESKTIENNDDSANKRKPYYLRPGDQLRLDLANPGYDFFNEFTIDNQGTANLNLLGWIKLEKKTVEQAEKMLIEAYKKDFFKNPQVNLRLVTKAKLRFKILGQVAQPGFYEVPPGLEVDLLDAIAIAGGYTRLANKVTYKYFAQETETSPVTEKVEIYKIRDLKRTVGKDKIPVLNGDDTIVVGESIF